MHDFYVSYCNLHYLEVMNAYIRDLFLIEGLA